MGKFATFFAVYTKGVFRSKVGLLALLLLPLTVFALCHTLQSDQSNALRVAIYFNTQDDTTDQLWDNLIQWDQFTFAQLDSEQAVYDGVAQGDFAVGYVFPADFTQRLEALRIGSLVDVVCLQNAPYTKYLSLLVLGAVYEPLSVEIAGDYLSLSDEEQALLLGEIQAYQEAENRFTITLLSVDGVAIQAEDSHNLPLVQGVICLFLLALSCAATLSCLQNKTNPFAPHLSTAAFQLYQVAPMYVLGTVAALVSWGVAQAMGVAIDWGAQLVSLLVYQGSLLFGGLLLAQWLSYAFVVVMVPFVLLFVAVSHPIFMDMVWFLPWLEPLLLALPTYQYLDNRLALSLCTLCLYILLYYGIHKKSAACNWR